MPARFQVVYFKTEFEADSGLRFPATPSVFARRAISDCNKSKEAKCGGEEIVTNLWVFMPASPKFGTAIRYPH